MKKNIFVAFLSICGLYADNQTPTVNAPLSESGLPYRLQVRQADFSLPSGLHSFVFAIYEGEWLMLSGRTNGLHNVDTTDPSDNSFPVANQNTTVYVVNPSTKQTFSRSLLDPASKLSSVQIEQLSVTNALFLQSFNKKTLYMVGGYGINQAKGQMDTKAVLTAIDVPSLIKWVKRSKQVSSVAQCIRQVNHPLLQVTGGEMVQANPHQPFLLAFGQNFDGNYTQSSSGTYTYQVRPFQIIDTKNQLFIQPYNQPAPIASYRRRDLNVVPVIKKSGNTYVNAFVALSGVFTPGGADNPGAWTVPIEIAADGSSKTFDPSNPNTFAQGMNNYACANLGLYSEKTNDMFNVLFGGLSYLIVSDGNQDSCTACPPPNEGILTTCDNLPFVNDITTVRIDSSGNYGQYLMSAKFPTIIADFGTQPGGPIWFGSSAAFFPADNLPMYSNGVIAFDKLGSKPVFLGYIVGGIASSVTDTNDLSDSQASTYIFSVILEPVHR